MAYPDYTGWGVSQFDEANKKQLVRDVHPLIVEVLKRDPLLPGYLGHGAACKQTEHEWFERDWIPFQFRTEDDITTTDGQVVNLIAADYGNEAYSAAGDLVMCVGSSDGSQKAWKEVIR